MDGNDKVQSLNLRKLYIFHGSTVPNSEILQVFFCTCDLDGTFIKITNNLNHHKTKKGLCS